MLATRYLSFINVFLIVTLFGCFNTETPPRAERSKPQDLYEPRLRAFLTKSELAQTRIVESSFELYVMQATGCNTCSKEKVDVLRELLKRRKDAYMLIISNDEAQSNALSTDLEVEPKRTLFLGSEEANSYGLLTVEILYFKIRNKTEIANFEVVRKR